MIIPAAMFGIWTLVGLISGAFAPLSPEDQTCHDAYFNHEQVSQDCYSRMQPPPMTGI